MVYSLQKSTVAKVVGISLVMMLAACTSDQRYKRQVSGDEVLPRRVGAEATERPCRYDPAGAKR